MKPRTLKNAYQIITITGIAIALSQLSLGCTNRVDDFPAQCVDLITRKAYQEALPDCNQAILLGSNSAIDYTRRGFVYSQLGKYKEAIEDYNQALLLQPDAIIVFNNRCFAHYRAGKYQQAIEDCDRVVQDKPDFAGAYANRGRARAGLKKDREAIQDYQIALKLFLKQGNQEGYQAVLKDFKQLQKQ